VRLIDRLPRDGLFAALAYRPFALLWTSEVVSRVGDTLTNVALAWWVLEETGSAAAMAKLLVATTVPMLLLLLVGGVVVDRVDRLRLLLVCDLVRGVCIATVAVLAVLDALAFWHLIALGAVFGTAIAFSYPAFVALTPALVPVEAMTSAVSLRSLSVRAASIVGPALGGVIVAAGGTSVAFGLDAASFAVSAGLVAATGRLVPAPPAAERRGGGIAGAAADLREGFATVGGSPWLWVTIVVTCASLPAMIGPIQAVLPLLVDDELGGSVRDFALLTTAAAVGAVAVAVWLGQRGRRLRRRGPVLYASWLAAAACVAGLGLGTPAAVAVVLMLGYGVGWGLVNLLWATLLQELVPPERLGRLGRVASIDALGSLGLAPVGYAVAGYAADRWGASPTFLVGGITGAIVIAAGLLHPGVRAVD